ncbi:MAG: bifunctional (p)ppGpp synthetase/guanosine-3',5'-bis(diphosphate) 3'-pyrophosphohydrolase [Candidatus Margulisiibacteriota bacterium]
MVETDILIEKIIKYDPQADLDLVKKAAQFAASAHEGQYRLSGEPFITHPIAVACILADLEQDIHSIVAALLHDAVEDGHVSEDSIRQEFGESVRKLVMGVTKLGKLTFESKEERQAENFRKMFVAMAQDLRIILIKLSDRLHNMQTLMYLPPDRQKDIAKETMEIYAPLAHRLGMWKLKWELEDLSFYYLEPEQYAKIKELVSEKKEERERYIQEFIEKVKDALLNVGISTQIAGRSKHFYSIYSKLVQKNVEFDDIYDLIAIRVIVDSIKDCYAVLGIVHSIWKPVPGRFRDFIALPKPNGYQTLHTTVMGSNGKPVEIQIRTKQMHRMAEYGIAAHWKYKEGVSGDETFDKKLSWIREMLDYQKEVKSAKDFLENVKIDFFMDEVFVYSPKGDVYDLPVGSTPIDFAYHVHTQVGHKCVGAKVNGHIVPLDYVLKNGDIVHILTSSKEAPKIDWLKFARTSGTRNKIKQWFKKEKREEHIVRGHLMLEDEFKRLGLDMDETLSKVSQESFLEPSGSGSFEDFCALVGSGEISFSQAMKQIRKVLEDEKILSTHEQETAKVKTPPQRSRAHSEGIRVVGMENILTRLSKCCFPLPGDEIVGFVTKGRGVSVHRADCQNVAKDTESGHHLVKIEWDSDGTATYPAGLDIEAFDRVGLIKDILAQISETRTNIDSVEVKTAKGSRALVNVVVDVPDVDHLKNIMTSIRKLSDVYDVYRVSYLK